MKVVILAGGGGTRLFPISRKNYPKQFMKIDSDKSLLAETIGRYVGTGFVKPEDMVIVTNQDYYLYVRDELGKCSAEEANVICEPHARNTAPAIGLAVKFLVDKLGCSNDEEVFVAPADHIIRPASEFVERVKMCIEGCRKGKIMTLGVTPDKPETGYGYIKAAGKWEIGYEVERFVEKPDKQTAEKYLKEGCYYWNSGMFAFTIGTFYEELKKHEYEIYSMLEGKTFEQVLECFADMKNISIDYAIAERSSRVAMLPIGVYWNDVGSWDSIYEFMQKDENGNVLSGDCVVVDCRDSLFMSKDRLVTGIGLSDILVVETNDTIMVAKKGESQKVKQLVDKLNGRPEANEHTTVFRPWGSYTILSEGDGYKVKKITVDPGKKLSLQLHRLRSEHWIVINGKATVIIGGDDQRTIRKNESIYVPKETKHRLMNLDDEPLEIIEVQNGSYLGEDDIERFDDVYGRE